jgi:preprotein translocase subunit SecE
MVFFVQLGRRLRRSVTGIGTFFRGSWHELKKVKWPSRREMINYTAVVFFMVGLLTVFFFVLDWGIFEVVHRIVRKS